MSTEAFAHAFSRSIGHHGIGVPLLSAATSVVSCSGAAARRLPSSLNCKHIAGARGGFSRRAWAHLLAPLPAMRQAGSVGAPNGLHPNNQHAAAGVAMLYPA